jgi:hypothetical protein
MAMKLKLTILISAAVLAMAALILIDFRGGAS